MKYRSKDLICPTGDKHSDLYSVSKKIEFLRPKVDRKTEEIEYEKNKNECTFKPNRDASERSFKKLPALSRIPLAASKSMPRV